MKTTETSVLSHVKPSILFARRGSTSILQKFYALGWLASLVLLGACSSTGSDDDGGALGTGSASALSGGSGPGGGTNTGGVDGGGGAVGTGSLTGGGGAGTGSTPGDGGTSTGVVAGDGGAFLGGTGGGATTGGASGSEEEYPFPAAAPDEDGGELWLRYPEVSIPGRLAEYQAAFTHVANAGASDTLTAAAAELVRGLSGLTGVSVAEGADVVGIGAVVIGTPESSAVVAASPLAAQLPALGADGYLVEMADVEGQSVTIVAGNTDVGVLYGSFALLRHLQSHNTIAPLALSGSPKVEHRILNHWDNLDGSVERGYAGDSIWDWGALPGTISPRYEEYARANASIGINGTVVTNVNADANALKPDFLNKVKALADIFRPYGIRIYLTSPFNAPETLGGTADSDPSKADVQAWWKSKADEIYALIPDFGGFLIKANSEGQPGPLQYGRTHAEGANVLAEAVGADRGIVMWRAFVYSEESSPDGDRIREAYDEFKPLDGQFNANVMVQAKNGALDFQPREPFAPLFGGMPQTPIALELQVTKEYLGQDTHLAYLGPMYEEVLKADTFAKGAGSTVARVVDGSLYGYSTTAMAGVSNVGDDKNWTGTHFNQANWYVYGRMAWDPDLGADVVAEEWVRQTLSNDPAVVAPVVAMMMGSREALVNYMTPLGLVHIMATTHHYGPGPWVNNLSRPEWNPFYYHKADASGIGFDRTASGSNAIEQYFPEVQDMFGREKVSDEYLLFFHRAGWDDTVNSGRTVWEELVHRYSLGVDQVGAMRDAWAAIADRIDGKRFSEISDRLEIQHYEARWWRDACLTYFDSHAGKGIPAGYAQPVNDLSYYQNLTDNNCPGDRDKPRCPAIETGDPSPAIVIER